MEFESKIDLTNINKESLIGKCSKDCHHNINCEECNGHGQCHNCDYL